MSYIKTTRGWRLLHKRHYEIAKYWRQEGWEVEEKVEKLDASDFWVSERTYNYWDVVTRLVYSARQRARKSSIEFSISLVDFEIPKVCPLRGVPFKVGIGQHTDDSPTLDRKDPRLGYIKGNVWVISHKANRLKGDFTPNELRTFCENALELDWVTWTSDDSDELRRREAEWKRKMNGKHKPRWWALWGSSKSEMK
ncbi:hypothetical protein [Bradyrhizobium sp. 930_D9_N1_4]|uniref:hypothetical protein n=1 Tax=Bradyrhizobium sp. 930_D9_N1_4 TaxID=3240374 RepID=UPI003F8B93BB